MIRRAALIACLALAVTGCGSKEPTDKSANAGQAVPAAQAPTPAAAPKADIVRVALATEAGEIVVALDAKHAPITTANFLAYVDKHRFDGTVFYRASRTKGAEKRGFIQGGIRRNYRLMLSPIAHEPTSKTGLKHVDGAISMARGAPGTAMGNFFITVGAMPQMDAHGKDPGFAVFGHVEKGMDVVRKILAAPTVPNAGEEAMKGQMIARPVRIVSAKRTA
jgi:peptidyl-prolyl cis-trans isomerase A (cyclophilin A)